VNVLQYVKEADFMMDLHGFDRVATDYDYFLLALGLNHDGFEEFHLTLAEKYGENGILDIACGTGALTIPLVKNGYDVTAFDLSASMVEITNQKLKKEKRSANLFVANMIDFRICRKFSLAIIARSGFMYLLTAAEQRQTLLNIREHLIDGGVLTLNTFQPHPIFQAERIKAAPEDYFFSTEYVNHEGKKERIFYAASYDYITQIFRGKWKFETLDDNGVVINTRVCPQVVRHTYRQETEYLFELCGYEILDVCNSYARDTAKDHLIWVVRKK
jgi:SAM-dependent methyltransferase